MIICSSSSRSVNINTASVLVQFYCDLLELKIKLAKELRKISHKWNELGGDDMEAILKQMKKLLKKTEQAFTPMWTNILQLIQRSRSVFLMKETKLTNGDVSSVSKMLTILVIQ